MIALENNNSQRPGKDSTRKFRPVGDVPIGERPVYGQGGRTRVYPDKTNAGARRPVQQERPAQRPASQNAKKSKKRKKSAQEITSRRRARLARFIAFLLVIGISVGLAYWALSCINDILPMDRSTDKISVSVSSEMNTDQVIDLLADKDLIRNKEFCKLAAKVLGYDDTKYLTSVYELQASYGLEKMLMNMSKSSLGAETVKLSFPEGYNMEQIFQKLEANGVCSAASLRATAREVDFSSDYDFLKSIPNKIQRYYYLEGYLYPDTYEFYVGENATSVIDRFLTNFENHWKEEYDERATELGFTADQVVNLASVIEKEAYGKEQMYQISSVLHNRLHSGGEFSYLQCDSTSNYFTYVPDTALSGDQRIYYSRLYDTYVCIGLPAGPICSPGAEAINAALHPYDTDYYYFRHDANKKIYLAETKGQHDRNGQEVLRVNAQTGNG